MTKMMTGLIACAFAFFGLAGVSIAATVTQVQDTAAGCTAQMSGTYGTLNYKEADSDNFEKVEGEFKLWVCQGIFFSFDGAGAVEVNQVFSSQEQLEWFLSDLQFMYMGFTSVDPSLEVDDREFLLYPHVDDLGNHPTHLLLRAPDYRATGIAIGTADPNTLKFFNFKKMGSPSFAPAS